MIKSPQKNIADGTCGRDRTLNLWSPVGRASTELPRPAKTVFVCVEVLRPSQPNGVMSSAVSLPNHTFTGQA